MGATFQLRSRTEQYLQMAALKFNMAEQSPDKSDSDDKLEQSTLQYGDSEDIVVGFVEGNRADGSVPSSDKDSSTDVLENGEKREHNNDISDLTARLSISDNAESKEAEESEEVKIVPIEDPYKKATKYLAKHNIIELFQVLCFISFVVTMDACA